VYSIFAAYQCKFEENETLPIVLCVDDEAFSQQYSKRKARTAKRRHKEKELERSAPDQLDQLFSSDVCQKTI
jgi:hypothetical protein